MVASYSLEDLEGGKARRNGERLNLEVGEPYDIRPMPPSTIRRVEAGMFNGGLDMDVNDNPFQISGIDRLVEFTGRDYVGREARKRIEHAGVDRKLVGVEIETWNTVPWPAFHDGNRVGEAPTTTWSPRLEQSIGYVWVTIELAVPGTELTLEKPTGETGGGDHDDHPVLRRGGGHPPRRG